MSFLDSISTSVFGMSVVFLVLIALSFIISIQSKLVEKFHTKDKSSEQSQNEIDSAKDTMAAAESDILDGELKLTGVDEKTAATIMAIVSHESQIPLSELQFKYIKAVDSKN